MKYIKTFETFNIKQEMPTPEIGADMATFNSSENNVKDFNTRKQALLNIYLTYAEDPTPTNTVASDLFKKLVTAKFIKPGDVKGGLNFINPLFTVYSEFCRKSRDTKNTENTLDQKQAEIADKQKSIATNTGDRETANNDIANLNNDIKDQTDVLNKSDAETTQLQKAAKDELTNKAKELENAKKRITKFDSQK